MMVCSSSSTVLFQATRHLVLEAVSSTTILADSRLSTVPLQAIELDTVEVFTITVVRSLSSTVPSQTTKPLLKTLPVGVSLILASSRSSIVLSRAMHHLPRGAASPSLAAKLLLSFVPFIIILHTMVAVYLF